MPSSDSSVHRWAVRHPEPVSEIEVALSLQLATTIEKALGKRDS